MSLMDQIQEQQKKRQNNQLEVVAEEPARVKTEPRASRPVAHETSAPALNLQPERQTRQLGYRVSVDTIQRFEAYRNKLNELARKKGFKRQSYGDLAEIALKLLMEHDPRTILSNGR